MTNNQSIRTDETREVSALRSASLTGTEVPQRILLAPWGAVESTHGSFVVDDESAALVEKAFAEHGTDLPIDYEHQTLGGTYSSPNGQAPAAGWIKRLIPERGVGLLAEIEWTDRAKELLASRQYRYLSPVAIIRKSDRKLVALHSAALTNKPAIVGMEPIVNRDDGTPFDDETLLDTAAVDSLQAIRQELDLPADAEADEVLVAAGARLTQLREDARLRHVEKRVHEAMKAGKLVEAQRAWAEALVAREERLFDEWLRTAPTVVTCGATRPPNAHDAAGRRQQTVIHRARCEYRTNPLLARLTTEEAYIADAIRKIAR